MPITDVLIRSLSGYIFVIPGILLYFLYLRKSGKKQTPLHIVSVSIFCYYLIGVLTMTGIGKLKSFEPRIVLIPFLDMEHRNLITSRLLIGTIHSSSQINSVHSRSCDVTLSGRCFQVFSA